MSGDQHGQHGKGVRPHSPPRPLPVNQMSTAALVAAKEELVRMIMQLETRYRKVCTELDNRGDTAAATHGATAGNVPELPQYLSQAGPREMYEYRAFPGHQDWSDWYCLKCEKWADETHVATSAHLTHANTLARHAGHDAAAEPAPPMALPAEAAAPTFGPPDGVAGAPTATRTRSRLRSRSRSRSGRSGHHRQNHQHRQRRSDSRDPRDSRRHHDSGPRHDSRRRRDSRDGHRGSDGRHTREQPGRDGVWR